MADKNFPINDNNLAIAYYRFSSHSQNEASIDQQRDCAHEYAVSKGLTIVREYSDAAISGTTNARPQYQLMLSEIDKIKPAVLILWKTDRLGRNKIELIVAKKMIRESGCRIHLIAEPTPDDSPESGLMETILEGMTEFYSKNLSCNIRRGMEYNARHALFNGHAVFGYCVGSDKKYVINPAQAPFVQRMFTEYADGKALTDIVRDMDAQGLRTSRGVKFSVNTVNKMLKNRAYIGEYHFGDIVIPDGMPALIDATTFDRVQERLRLNQRFGSQRKQVSITDEAPRFWLTGKLFCGECGSSMQGISGTSKTKAKHYYYGCKGQRAKRCHKKAVRKAWIEKIVIRILTDLLNDTENLASLAIDAANYYNKNYRDTGYLESLEARRREVEKGLANFVKAIEMGVFNESTQKRMAELQEEKNALTEAIEAELVRQALYEDEHSIQAYFDKYLHADLNDPDVRESVLNYFVDKIWLYDDKLVISGWFSEDKTEIPFDMVDEVTKNGAAGGFVCRVDCSTRRPICQNGLTAQFVLHC
ncbi:MAG: recombinase family protein [Eubacterium sp.]|nr:recombinase family protein [Eubacterium sp.]